MLKRVTIWVAVFAVVLVTMAQGLPHASAAMAGPSMACMEMGGDCDRPMPPCKGLTPVCMDMMGCVSTPGLPGAAFSALIPFEWSEPGHPGALPQLSGITVKPELSPPILRA